MICDNCRTKGYCGIKEQDDKFARKFGKVRTHCSFYEKEKL